MVFLNYLIALAFLSLSFGILLLMISRNGIQLFFGQLFLLLAAFLILSSSVLTIDTMVFFIIGLIFVAILFFFNFRDKIYLRSLQNDERRKSNE